MHTDVLIASATFKESGMAVPLRCTWYTKTSDRFEVIQNVCSACYQPCIDDVDKVIVVHGVPASDIEEYQGMPMLAETELLKADPYITEVFNQNKS